MYKYKNIFNNSKLLKSTFIKKIKYYSKSNTFITKNIYKNLYCYKKNRKILVWKESERRRGEWEGSRGWKRNGE